MIDRLVLGTAQLGMCYGINNKIGKPDFIIARDIIKAAFDNGITRFDTSQAYGDSEEVLGNVFDDLKINTKVKVYSKLDPKLILSDRFAVRASVENSLRKLKINQLEGLSLHHESNLDYWDKGLSQSLQGLVASGEIGLVGVSFYASQRALDVLDIEGIDMIQIPANILDRRFENIGVFSKAKERGKDIFVRSILLQGLLLTGLDCVPDSMRYVLPYLEQLEKIASDLKLSRQQLVLGYAAQKWPKAFVLFGAESSGQVVNNLKVLLNKPAVNVDDNPFKDVPENLLNPVLWPKL